MQPQRYEPDRPPGTRPLWALHRGALWIALLAIGTLAVPLIAIWAFGPDVTSTAIGVATLIAGLVMAIVALLWSRNGRGWL